MHYFQKYKAAVRNNRSVTDRRDLFIGTFSGKRIYYAPFDYLNPDARVFIVGLTPGEVQMKNMIAEARKLLLEGYSDADVLKLCKHVGSFSGPMREALIAMLDELDVHQFLRIESSAELFAKKVDLANFTSAVRYPTFEVKDGEEKNFNGSIVSQKELFDFAAPLTLEEIRRAPHAIIIPLGPNVEAYLQKVLSGFPEASRLMPALPHPSGANNEWTSYFLGRKDKSLLSKKTNPNKIDHAKKEFLRRLAALKGRF